MCISATSTRAGAPADRAPVTSPTSTSTPSSTSSATSDGPPGRSSPSPRSRRRRGVGVRGRERSGSGQPSQAGGSVPSKLGGVTRTAPSRSPPRGRCGRHGRPRGGGVDGRQRCSRIFRAANSSSTTEISCIVLPQAAQASASIPQLRRNSTAHSRRRGRIGSSGPSRSGVPSAGGAERPILGELMHQYNRRVFTFVRKPLGAHARVLGVRASPGCGGAFNWRRETGDMDGAPMGREYLGARLPRRPRKLLKHASPLDQHRSAGVAQ